MRTIFAGRLGEVLLDPLQQHGHDYRGAVCESRTVDLDADDNVAGRGRGLVPVGFDQPREEARVTRAPRESHHDSPGGPRRPHDEQVQFAAGRE